MIVPVCQELLSLIKFDICLFEHFLDHKNVVLVLICLFLFLLHFEPALEEVKSIRHVYVP